MIGNSVSNALTAISRHEASLLAYSFGVMVAVYLATSLTIVVIYYRRSKRETAADAAPHEQSA